MNFSIFFCKFVTNSTIMAEDNDINNHFDNTEISGPDENQTPLAASTGSDFSDNSDNSDFLDNSDDSDDSDNSDGADGADGANFSDGAGLTDGADSVEDSMLDEEAAEDIPVAPTPTYRVPGASDKKHQLSGMFRNWYLEYASYVILERAVPHIEDGLKPVDRKSVV